MEQYTLQEYEALLIFVSREFFYFIKKKKSNPVK